MGDAGDPPSVGGKHVPAVEEMWAILILEVTDGFPYQLHEFSKRSSTGC